MCIEYTRNLSTDSPLDTESIYGRTISRRGSIKYVLAFLTFSFFPLGITLLDRSVGLGMPRFSINFFCFHVMTSA